MHLRRRKRTRQISIEKTESILVRIGAHSPSAWCDDCGTTVSTLSLQEAYATAGSVRTIDRWIETGRIHSCGARQGNAQICIPSLYRLLEAQPDSFTPSESPGSTERSK